MRYALVDGARKEAQSKLVGECPHCGSTVIAKCGPINMDHWAHKNRASCDFWWDSETEWHRYWKNEFPKEWQERSRRDANGELHISDVLTPTGLTIEFQHSPIKREEVEIRTRFHNRVCWIVDGTRLKTGWKNFQKALWIGFKQSLDGLIVHKIFSQDSKLLRQWSGLDCTVVFDFAENGLWVKSRSNRIVALAYPIDRNELIEVLKKGQQPPLANWSEHN